MWRCIIGDQGTDKHPTQAIKSIQTSNSVCHDKGSLMMKHIRDPLVFQSSKGRSFVASTGSSSPTSLLDVDEQNENEFTQEIFAVEELKLAIQQDLSNWKLHYKLGSLLLDSQLDLETAREHLVWSIALSSRRVEPYLCLGRLYRIQKLFNKAIHIYQKAIVLENSNAELWAGLGLTYEVDGNLEQARAAYATAINIDPNIESGICCYNLGNLYHRTGDFNQSIPLYLSFLQVQPKHTEACYNLAIGYQRLGDEINAKKYFELLAKVATGSGEFKSDTVVSPTPKSMLEINAFSS